MTKRKLERFEECKSFTNLFQFGFFDLKDDFRLKGKWNKEYFGNENPIVLELGCGKGDYTVSLGRRNADKNYIGIDSKGARLWRGCRTAIDEGLGNVAFIRSHIEWIERLFAPGEVSELWITFPDPQPRKPRKRLTSPRFLDHYSGVLKPTGNIHLKTDNYSLYAYTLEVIYDLGHSLHYDTPDLYNNPPRNEATEIQTFYEKMFLCQGVKITYLRFSLNSGK